MGVTLKRIQRKQEAGRDRMHGVGEEAGSSDLKQGEHRPQDPRQSHQWMEKPMQWLPSCPPMAQGQCQPRTMVWDSEARWLVDMGSHGEAGRVTCCLGASFICNTLQQTTLLAVPGQFCISDKQFHLNVVLWFSLVSLGLRTACFFQSFAEDKLNVFATPVSILSLPGQLLVHTEAKLGVLVNKTENVV